MVVSFWQVKQIEKRDSVLTSKQQIDRLLRPGASYFNLNPFEVSVLSEILSYQVFILFVVNHFVSS